MIDIEAIVAAAKARGGQVEDPPASRTDAQEPQEIPELFRTAAMARVLARQGLKGLTKSWNMEPSVVTSCGALHVELRSHNHHENDTPVSIQMEASGDIVCTWRIPDEINEALENLIDRMTTGITLRYYDDTFQEHLADISPLPSSGEIHLTGLPLFTMARASLYLELGAQRWNLFSTKRLCT